MNFMNLFRKKSETRNAVGVNGWPVGLPGTARSYAVSPDCAQSLSAVAACVSAISTAISGLPVLIHQVQGKSRVEVESGPIFDMFKHGPNPYQTTPEFFEMLVAEVLLRGNALVEIRDGLRVIPWHWCNVQMLSNGRLCYDAYDAPGIWAPSQGRRRRLLQNEVIHIRDRSDDGLIGKSRLQRAAAVINSAQTLFRFSHSILENGLFPSTILTTPAHLDDAQIAGVQRAFASHNAGPGKAGKVMVIPGEFQVEKMSFSPEDAELLENLKFSTIEICRLFQVPPPILQDYSHNTFTNAAQASRWFSQFCLLPWVRKIESSFNRALFAGTDYEMTLDMSSFDRGDPEQRWQAHAIAASNQILTVDEIREIEGWGPLPEKPIQPESKTQGDSENDEGVEK